MEYFTYKDKNLYAEGVSLEQLANTVGTPCFVYSRAAIISQWHALDEALAGHSHLICYAVKANSNLATLQALAQLGSGFDIVSVGELERVLLAGGNPAKVVFSGVGKRADELRRALQVGIRCFNVESEAEMHLLNRLAGEMGKHAPMAVRVNPDIDAQTHPYNATGLHENKFGIDAQKALEVYRQAARLPNIDVLGIDCHIGSQLTETGPFVNALDRVLDLVDELAKMGICLQHVDIGGGLGIRYRDTDSPPPLQEYASALLEKLGDRPLELLLEPGRCIVGNAGVLLTRLLYTKRAPAKNFAIVDAAMNDLIRPALYTAWHDIIPVQRRHDGIQPSKYDVVGPVCESADFLAIERELSLADDDLLAVCCAGAYCFSMSSNYNTRPRAVEVMVTDEKYHIVRERETFQDLMSREHLVPTN